MNPRSSVGRLVRALPATTVSIVSVLLIIVAIFYQAAFNPLASPFSSIALPLVVISLLGIFIGLSVDGSVNAGATTRWDEELAISATDLERRVSTFFASRGWTAQRDDADFKAFVHRPQLNIGLLIVLLLLGVMPALIYLLAFAFRRSEAVLIEIGSTVAGARIEMQGPWSAVRPFYRSLDLDAPRLSPLERLRSGSPPRRAGSTETTGPRQEWKSSPVGSGEDGQRSVAGTIHPGSQPCLPYHCRHQQATRLVERDSGPTSGG